jgi:hypothetical protein
MNDIGVRLSTLSKEALQNFLDTGRLPAGIESDVRQMTHKESRDEAPVITVTTCPCDGSSCSLK